jgi:ring-1,2-phenylacetyl-CoA epoxidase subunit PaaD
MVGTLTHIDTAKIWELLETVPDPEIPVLSILDLGIVRKIEIENNNYTIYVTPTYSGCPAVDAINMDIKLKLLENNIRNFTLKQQLAPAWTTDWISEVGKQKMLAYGIAPPKKNNNGEDVLPACPQCNSANTKLLSQFGSTACKALYQCQSCKEPFDYFKCH